MLTSCNLLPLRDPGFRRRDGAVLHANCEGDRARGKRQPVIIRSSILPSTFEQCCRIFEDLAPGLIDLGVNPEFLREGTAISDFENPPLVVIGTSVPRIEEMLKQLYSNVRAPLYVLPPKEALLVKYA